MANKMSDKQAMLTALGCAGSLAAVLAVASPAAASPVAMDAAVNADNGLLATDFQADDLLAITHADSNPIMDALSCGCARCAVSENQPAF